MTVLVYGITGASLLAQLVKNLPAMQETNYNAGDPDSIPGSGRSPGEKTDNPLQYSCLENPMDSHGRLQSMWVTRAGQNSVTKHQ